MNHDAIVKVAMCLPYESARDHAALMDLLLWYQRIIAIKFKYLDLP